MDARGYAGISALRPTQLESVNVYSKYSKSNPNAKPGLRDLKALYSPKALEELREDGAEVQHLGCGAFDAQEPYLQAAGRWRRRALD